LSQRLAGAGVGSLSVRSIFGLYLAINVRRLVKFTGWVIRTEF